MQCFISFSLNQPFNTKGLAQEKGKDLGKKNTTLQTKGEMNLCTTKLSNDKMKASSRDKVKKCNQCNYASTNASTLKDHIKTHTGAKPNKCQQCDYASSQISHLRTHLKAHSGEKPNRCNQCQYASSHASNLRKHLKTHSRESHMNATNATLLLFMQAI